MKKVYIKGTPIQLAATQSFSGGEANIYILGDRILKLYKEPDDPDYENNPDQQEAARKRIEVQQKKLKVFPLNLPGRVIVPEELATNRAGTRLVGYLMKYVKSAEPLLRYSDIDFRTLIDNNVLVKIFLDMHQTVREIHKTGTVIGDFNDLNVLVKGNEAYFIDADSFQFGGLLCQGYTERFVDPLLCDITKRTPELCRPYGPNADWYAFTVMLVQCLFLVNPYDGVYRPSQRAKRIPHETRWHERITIFDPEVGYPKHMTPFKVFPDELLHYVHRVFKKDVREEFPKHLLETMQWITCPTCHVAHATYRCPECAQSMTAAIRETVVMRGQATSTRIFQTNGTILFAAMQEGQLRWLFHEQGTYKREHKESILQGNLDPRMRFRIHGDQTLVGKGNQLVTIGPQGSIRDQVSVDGYDQLPMFDANAIARYWLESGRLLRDGQWGPECVGDVVEGHTLFWAGPRFGFGFYRIGNITVAFVFDAVRHGINDSVHIAPLRGHLVDATCVFNEDRCWFFVSLSRNGKIINQCFVIDSDGAVVAASDAEQGDGTWLSHIRGKCAAGNFLLAVTHEGIVRVETEKGNLVVRKSFPDTEPFVDTSCHLYAGKNGLYVVSRKEISILKIS